MTFIYFFIFFYKCKEREHAHIPLPAHAISKAYPIVEVFDPLHGRRYFAILGYEFIVPNISEPLM